jgi:hypothetical protein
MGVSERGGNKEMAEDSMRLLTRIKLTELQCERDLLHDQYAAIEEQAAEADTPVKRLKVLYDGLRQMKSLVEDFIARWGGRRSQARGGF